MDIAYVKKTQQRQERNNNHFIKASFEELSRWRQQDQDAAATVVALAVLGRPSSTPIQMTVEHPM
jgi:hypothetical protein